MRRLFVGTRQVAYLVKEMGVHRVACHSWQGTALNVGGIAEDGGERERGLAPSGTP